MIVFLFKFLRDLLFAELAKSNNVEIPYVPEPRSRDYSDLDRGFTKPSMKPSIEVFE